MFFFIEFHVWESIVLKQIYTTSAFLWLEMPLILGQIFKCPCGPPGEPWPPAEDRGARESASPVLPSRGSGSSEGPCLFGWPAGTSWFRSDLNSRESLLLLLTGTVLWLITWSFSPQISFLLLISLECKLQELCQGQGFLSVLSSRVSPAPGSVSGVHSRCSIKMCSMNSHFKTMGPGKASWRGWFIYWVSEDKWELME